LAPWASYPENFWRVFYPQFQSYWPVYVLAGLGIIAGLRRRSSFRVLSGWLLFSFGGVVVGGFFRGHYFIQILPAIALLAAGQLVLMTSQRWPRNFFVVSVVAVVLMIGYSVWKQSWYYGPVGPDEKARKIYGKNPFVESLAVGKYIADHSTSTDHVFIFGSEPQILYYADRPSASRYFYVYPLIAGSDSGGRQQQVLFDLLDHQPKFIVTVFIPTSFGISAGVFPRIFLDMHNVLGKSYRFVAAIPDQFPGPVELVEGRLAQEMWNKNPFWYNGRPWCTLAIWQRNT
jgi:hypothetical protein